MGRKISPTDEVRQEFRTPVAEVLLELGVLPRPNYRARIREQVNDLYRFELQRERLLHRELERTFGPQSVERLRRRVQDLRGKYWVLSLPIPRWHQDSESDSRTASEEPNGANRDQRP